MKPMLTPKVGQYSHYSVVLDLAFVCGRKYFLDLSIHPVDRTVHRFNLRLASPGEGNHSPQLAPPLREP
jgi:hypothetical protein